LKKVSRVPISWKGFCLPDFSCLLKKFFKKRMLPRLPIC